VQGKHTRTAFAPAKAGKSEPETDRFGAGGFGTRCANCRPRGQPAREAGSKTWKHGPDQPSGIPDNSSIHR
jgi:hypothetical protein